MPDNTLKITAVPEAPQLLDQLRAHQAQALQQARDA
jgi:hypothetical protein